nr:hypothetical protein [Tanacetum cinerariifolium]
EAARAVVGAAPNEAAPGGEDEKLNAAERRAVDAVLAHPATGHDDAVAGQNDFLPAVFARKLHRHHGAGAAVHERFAAVAVIKNDGPVHGRHARLVATVLNTLAHTLKNAARVQLAGQQFAIVIRVSKAQHVGIEQQARTADAGSQRVAVVAQDAGDSSAVGVDGRGRVVRFDLPHEQRFGVDAYRAGVVRKHLNEPVVAVGSQLLIYLSGSAFDECFEQPVNLFFGARFVVFVLDNGAEFLVLAVLRPGLGQNLHLAVGGVGGQP